MSGLIGWHDGHGYRGVALGRDPIEHGDEASEVARLFEK
jgi:hypothetical protein